MKRKSILQPANTCSKHLFNHRRSPSLRVYMYMRTRTKRWLLEKNHQGLTKRGRWAPRPWERQVADVT